jgi:NAD+ kinase
MQKVRSFGVVAFNISEQIYSVVKRIQKWSDPLDLPLFFHPILKDHFPEHKFLTNSEKELVEKSDILISVGGDGTFLSIAHMVKFTDKPVIGINLGGLGFLAVLKPDNFGDSLERILNGDYSICNRMVIKATLYRNGKLIKTFHALNDIFINRYALPKLTSISAWYGSEYISDIQADGIIIATPTGSTAYSLSAGGPIVDPHIQAFILTPICPHSLTERPIILPAEDKIILKINNKNPELLLSADGIYSLKLHYNDEIVISYNGDNTHFIQFAEFSYFESLRKKLKWGQDIKQWRNREK